MMNNLWWCIEEANCRVFRIFKDLVLFLSASEAVAVLHLVAPAYLKLLYISTQILTFFKDPVKQDEHIMDGWDRPVNLKLF